MATRVIILAAGQGTRMKSTRPKVLHEIAGRSMVAWMIEAASQLSPAEIRVVVGHEADVVAAALPEGTATTLQEEQLGTAHAVELALADMTPEADDVIVVLPSDHPTLRGEVLIELVERHTSTGAAATLLTAVLDDPFGYGRVIRRDGAVVGVVEEVEAEAETKKLHEVATAIYAFSPDALTSALPNIGSDNVQSERYLPDVVEIFATAGLGLEAVIGTAADAAGINTYDQLAGATAHLQRTINEAWMAEGVWMVEPSRVYIDASAVLASDVRLYPGVHIEGASTVAPGAEIGPEVHIRDSRIGEEARIRYSVLEGAVVGPRVEVGPFARLRPGTVLGPESKAGTFVELKQTQVGARSKVPHLAYMGDATIGEDSNIGAGTITCNWDGHAKHQTIIGDRAFIGSDTMLVAPVAVGDDGWTGAGSTITKDVPPGSLAVERSAQREIADYAERKKDRSSEQEDS